MLVNPLQPLIPTDWLMLQGDQYRRQPETVPGLIGEQSRHDWLSQLVAAVQSLVRQLFRCWAEEIVSSLLGVNWLQEKTGVAPPRQLSVALLSPLDGGMF